MTTHNAELSRTDLRRCGSENVQHLHDAAKRCRLERHVMQRQEVSEAPQLKRS